MSYVKPGAHGFDSFAFCVIAAVGLFMNVAKALGAPNIVTILLDDVGYSDMTCYGGIYASTPVLDRLANEGLRFTDFYSSMALCSPTRSSIQTGRLPIRNGFYSNAHFGRNAVASQFVDGGLPATENTIAELLAAAGYRTALIGKSHLGFQPKYWPDQLGFQETLGSPGCHFVRPNLPETPGIPVIRNASMIGRYYEGEWAINRTSGESNITRMFADAAVDFVTRSARFADPFYLYFTPDGTHAPAYASKQFLGKSPRGIYGDSMTEVDFSIGRVLDALDEAGIRNNTLV